MIKFHSFWRDLEAHYYYYLLGCIRMNQNSLSLILIMASIRISPLFLVYTQKIYSCYSYCNIVVTP